MSVFDFVALILVLAAAIGLANERTVRLPSSVALLLGSILISLLLLVLDRFQVFPARAAVQQALDAADLPHVFLDGVLALLLFAASLHVNPRDLNESRWMILALATGSVIAATAFFTFGIWAAFALGGAAVPLVWCGVMGAILAPTDAVVVDALLRRLAMPASLRAAISGESLFNDGAGVVLFFIMLGMAGGEHDLIGRGRVAAALLVAGGGGFVIGAVCGWIASLAARLSSDHALQLTVSIALAMASYRLSLALDVSGPIAVVTAGLVLAQRVPALSVHDARPSVVVAFWTLLDGLLNTLLFLLLGMQILEVSYHQIALLPVAAAIPIALLARLVSVALPTFCRRGSLRDRMGELGVLTWAGLRGGVSIALALLVSDRPYRDQILAVCYAVVVFTILVQGLTLPSVTRLLLPPRNHSGVFGTEAPGGQSNAPDAR